jgi:hypothetical protein
MEWELGLSNIRLVDGESIDVTELLVSNVEKRS